MNAERSIVFDGVSKFYGEVLGVNQVNLSIPSGVTSLVGRNGAGKSTLMNLMTGLLRPSRGKVSVLGVGADDPERLFRILGYCTQNDAFPRGVTGRGFVLDWLTLHGFERCIAGRLADEAIERVGLTAVASRRVSGYSKGMRQRIRLALAISHHPTVLVLDEPLNGLDPMARAEVMALFQSLGRQGMHIVISSHVLHEVDRLSDQIVILSHGYVVADGQIHGVRREVTEHPMQISVRCSEPYRLAAHLFAEAHIVEAKMHGDGHGLLVCTQDVDAFYRQLQQIVVTKRLQVDSVAPADDDALALYHYLIGGES